MSSTSITKIKCGQIFILSNGDFTLDCEVCESNCYALGLEGFVTHITNHFSETPMTIKNERPIIINDSESEGEDISCCRPPGVGDTATRAIQDESSIVNESQLAEELHPLSLNEENIQTESTDGNVFAANPQYRSNQRLGQESATNSNAEKPKNSNGSNFSSTTGALQETSSSIVNENQLAEEPNPLIFNQENNQMEQTDGNVLEEDNTYNPKLRSYKRRGQESTTIAEKPIKNTNGSKFSSTTGAPKDATISIINESQLAGKPNRFCFNQENIQMERTDALFFEEDNDSNPTLIVVKNPQRRSYKRRGSESVTNSNPEKPFNTQQSCPVAEVLQKSTNFPKNRDRGFKCGICSKIFSSKWDLIDHETFHTDKETLQCEKCHKTFASVGYLNKHVKQNHAKILGKRKDSQIKQCSKYTTRKKICYAITKFDT